MKAEFEITVDAKTGEPKIRFKYYPYSGEIEQLLLGLFIEKAQTHEIDLICGQPSVEAIFVNYEIRIKK